MKEITVTELKEKIDAGENVQLIDVRQPDEFAFAKIDSARLIPLGEIIKRKDEIDTTLDTVVFCRSGARSAKAIQNLQKKGFQGNLINLIGGILAWSDQVDPNVPKY